jgi:protein MpaA
MAKKKKKIPAFLVGIWSLNIVGALFFFLWMGNPFRSSPKVDSVEEAISVPPTATLEMAPLEIFALPTVYLLPSVTPNPNSTPIVGTTPTPFAIDLSKKKAIAIGYSVAGRPLEVYRFGTGADERLIVAGIHGGNEWNTIALADELIAYLEENPDIVPKDVSLYILRALNPDGYERARGYEGRVNDHGVDLNHNFPYHWKENWNRDGCWDYLPTTGGTHPGSEPETIALMNFVSLHDFSALISYHSAALGIFAGGLPPFEPSERLAKALSDVSSYAYPPYNTGCDYSGNLTDWASSVKGVPAVDIELRNHRDTDFDDNIRVLKAFLTWQQ